MSPDWITAVVAIVALVGGAIWAAVGYFASNRYAEALEKNLQQLSRDFLELKETFTTHVSNEIYFRAELEKRETLLKKSEEIFRRVEERLEKIPA